MRVTGPLLKVLQVLLASPENDVYGLELIRATGLKSGTLYPLLDRMEAAGWLSSHWEESASTSGPRRRFYVLTGYGIHEGRQVLAEYGARAGFAWT